MQVQSARPAGRLKPWVISAFVFGLVLVCYWPALRGGLLWDDQAHVTRPDLRPLSGLWRIWTDIHSTQQYYPVLHSAFWIEHRWWGDSTFGYHLLNVLLHATSCCLLALILQRLLKGKRVQQDGTPTPGAPIASRRSAVSPVRHAQGPEPVEGLRPAASTDSIVAWLAALLFAVHPVCVESVAWISEQKNTLSLVFYLLAALAYLDFESTRRRRSYGAALALFALAIGTKTVTATLPAALLVLLWWKNGRLRWRRDVLPLVPWLALSLAAGLFTAWDERTLMGASGAEYALTAGQRALLAGRVIWFYLGKLAWPANLMFIYPRWDVPAAAAGWFGWAGGVLAVTAGLWLVRRYARGLPARAATAGLAGWLLFVGTLFPALGFFNVFPFLYSYVADHFQYHASLGLVATVAAGLAALWSRASPSVRLGGRVLGIALVAILALLTNRQSRIYRDGETLYRATIERNPACWIAYNNLGADLASSPGHAAEALAQYEQALGIRPDYPEAHNNLANLLATMPGRAPEALAHYETALRLKPDFSEAHDNLANLLATLPGRAPEALTHYEQALRLRPDNVDAHFNLAGLLATLPGREAEAAAHYQTALRLQPDYVEAYNNLAVLYARLGRTGDAIRTWEAALRINPNYADARTNLQRLKERLGR